VRIKDLEAKINELNKLLEQKDQEKKQLQDIYKNEMKNKLEQNNQIIFNLKNKFNEDIRKFHIDFEEKNFLEKKKYEDEKSELMEKTIKLEKELLLLYEKSGKCQKSDFVEFQKKYLTEMRELQTSFEDFKLKTYEEMKTLKKQKEEAIKTANNYEQEIERINYKWEQNENIYKENYRIMLNKLDSLKDFIKNNEILKNQLELSKSEIIFLKLKINKLENSEKSLQDILLEKSEGFSIQQNNLNTNYNTTDGFFNIEKGINFYNYQNSNRSEYSNYNYDDLNLIPHIQSPNPFTPGTNIIVNNSRNKSKNKTKHKQNNCFSYGNINMDCNMDINSNNNNYNNFDTNIPMIKKRSNSKSIMNNITSKL
jgi:hypothetical protein